MKNCALERLFSSYTLFAILEMICCFRSWCELLIFYKSIIYPLANPFKSISVMKVVLFLISLMKFHHLYIYI